MSTGKILSTLSHDYEKYVKKSSFDTLEENIKEGDTGGSFGNMSETDYDYLLLFNNSLPMFHELPYRVQVHLPSLMSRLGSTQVTLDHYHYWAWTAEVLRELNRDEEYLQKDVERMFLLAVDYAVGGLTSAPVSKQLWEENKKIEKLISPHARRAMLKSHRAATQLTHPLLEGLLRRLCSDYVRLDGQIKSGKKILKRNGNEQQGGRANNVGDMLYHYMVRVAGSETRCALISLRYEIESYSSSNSGFGVINSWRHPHSHGGERFSGPEHVVLLNVVCQLLWNTISRQDYDEIEKSQYSDKILIQNPFFSQHHFDYYPLKETRDLLIGRDWTSSPEI